MSTEFINDQWRLPNAFNGSESNVNKQSNYSMDFDGSSYISLPSSLDLGTNSTISLWFKSDSGNTNNTILGEDSYQYDYLLQIASGSNEAAIRIGGIVKPFTGITEINDGNWNHWCIVRNGDSVELFINNSSKGTQTGYGTGTNTKFEKIGAEGDNQFPITGKIDAVSIFNYALSSSQVTTLYGSSSTGIGNPMSLSPKPVAMYNLGDKSAFNGANYLVPNIAAEEADGDIATSYSPYALDFDGTDDYIQIPYNVNLTPQNGNFTISAWINTDNLSGWHSIWCTQNLSSSTVPLVSLHTFGDKVRAVVGGSTNNPSYPGSWALFLDSTQSLTISTWYHIAVSYNMSGNAQIYINGNADNSGPIENPQTSWTTGDRFIGDGEDFWDGRISNLSIWNTALTSAQVSEIYSEGIPQNLLNHSAVSSLVSWWQLGSNTSWVNPYWISLDEKGTNNGQSQNVAAPNNMGESAIVDGVGSYANGLSFGMGGDEVIGDAPYSTANSLSVNMDVEDRVTDTPS